MRIFTGNAHFFTPFCTIEQKNDYKEALISVNEKMNNYGHPDPNLISLLVAYGFNVERTDINGDLIVHL